MSCSIYDFACVAFSVVLIIFAGLLIACSSIGLMVALRDSRLSSEVIVGLAIGLGAVLSFIAAGVYSRIAR